MRKTLPSLKHPKRLSFKRKPIQNQIPGKIIYVGEETSEDTVINVISYNEEKVIYNNNCSRKSALSSDSRTSIQTLDQFYRSP